ncbi:DNA-binding response regulator [Flavobacterium noncentrifugens]|uniref:DNA-binding response regulator, OmpR family, contains REC and winged-helix (WHTH) domain n=1 Tax=Flavobacterium noncentrifugens TaxID=1128970 RepID=A0A1G8WSZ6_9FLAO|nr:response regulator transcription factor [Flavobacterium noncentrifugens]GEP51046.1 DNA-binding response regulator [Flavobacterium noncentrifugens]SDJ81478.1 DNA-binding response regulator, OmpR family, contains REC and winged-helix (wHTH) domain [Flavobacterium noncentrifugens]
MKILLIEDEPELRNSIKQYLEPEGNIVEVACDFVQAEQKIALYDYDCMLIDITIPKGSGLDLIKQIKRKHLKAGIIIISAKNSLDDKVYGLDLGADDYLPKPFYLPELNSRIKALVRRKNFDGDTEINFNEIKVLPDERRVLVNNDYVNLTIKEYDLLLYFMANKNRVVSKSALAEHLWGDNADGFNNYDFIYTHVKNLRKKLLSKGCEDYLHTIYGIGYNFKTCE